MADITILWGPQFANTLEINDGINYVSKSFDLFGGPQQDVLVADTLYSSPYAIRSKLKERVFSIGVRIRAELWGANYNTWLNDLKRAVYNGPFRVVVYREGVGSTRQYLTCRLEEFADGGGGDFIIKRTAADPVFIDLDN